MFCLSAKNGSVRRSKLLSEWFNDWKSIQMNKKLLYESDRLFSIYGYAMSHGLLLLRSGKSNETPSTRVDILFRDVRAVEIRTSFKGIRIEEVDDPQVLNNQGSNPGEMIEPGNKIYSLTSSEWSGFVVAGIVSFTEDDGSLFGPSSLVPDPPVERWSVG
jgi:hypothetical protein